MHRLVMLRGSSGFYCYAIFEHPHECPALNISVARLAFKLNATKYVHTLYICHFFCLSLLSAIQDYIYMLYMLGSITW